MFVWLSYKITNYKNCQCKCQLSTLNSLFKNVPKNRSEFYRANWFWKEFHFRRHQETRCPMRVKLFLRVTTMSPILYCTLFVMLYFLVIFGQFFICRRRWTLLRVLIILFDYIWWFDVVPCYLVMLLSTWL